MDAFINKSCTLLNPVYKPLCFQTIFRQNLPHICITNMHIMPLIIIPYNEKITHFQQCKIDEQLSIFLNFLITYVNNIQKRIPHDTAIPHIYWYLFGAQTGNRTRDSLWAVRGTMFLENSGFRFYNNHLFPINADASILNLNQTVIHVLIKTILPVCAFAKTLSLTIYVYASWNPPLKAKSRFRISDSDICFWLVRQLFICCLLII